jgi:hypothetical protein
VQAVGVLGRVDELEHPVGVDALRQRQLDDVAGAGRVGVEPLDRGLDVRLGGVGGQVLADRGDADLGAVLVLAADVRAAARVVADQDGAQSRDDPPLAQRGHPLGQLGLDRLRGRRPVQDLRPVRARAAL